MSTECIATVVDNDTDTIERLLGVCSTLYRTDPQAARNYAYEALALAEQQPDTILIARSMHIVGVSLFYCDEYKEALCVLVQATALVQTSDTPVLQARIQHTMGCIYTEMQQYKKALNLFRRCIKIFGQNDSPERTAISLNYMGLVYQNMGRYAQSLAMYLRALRIFRELQMQRHVGTCYTNIGTLYGLMEDFDRELDYAYKALSLYKAAGDLRGEAIALSNLAFKFLNTTGYNKAAGYIEQAIVLFHQMDSQARIARLVMAKGILCEKRGELRSALRYYKKSLALAKQHSDSMLRDEVYYNIGYVYRLLGESEKSIRYFRIALEMNKVNVVLSVQMDIYENLSLLYEEVHNPTEALACYKQYTSLKEKLAGCRQGKEFGEEAMRFRVEDVSDQKNKFREKSEQLATEIQKKNADLTMATLQLVQKNELLQRLMQKANRALHSSTHGKSKMLKDILCELKGHINTPEDRHDFRWHLGLLHSTELGLLTQHFPDLSPAEINICLLLKTGLGTKDIADILCLSSRTVDLHRYNIRKKLQLPTDANLTQFLMSLA